MSEGPRKLRLLSRQPDAPVGLLPPTMQCRGVLGQGGMGIVYQAWDVVRGREVAVKFLPPTAAGLPSAARRFESEGTVMAGLSHPNVVAFLGLGRHLDRDYLVMEYVDGGDLLDWLAEPRSLPEVCRLFAAVCDGLEHIHAAGLVHRDMKPENVLLTRDGVPKITDFGLVREVDPGTRARLTTAGAILGTYEYVAPEAILGREVGPAADLYALGACLFEAVTGRSMFTTRTDYEMLNAHLHDVPPAPSSLRPDVPPELDDLVLRLLQKDPDLRPASAAEVARVLRGLAAAPVGDAAAAAPGEVRPAPFPRQAVRSSAPGSSAVVASSAATAGEPAPVAPDSPGPAPETWARPWRPPGSGDLPWTAPPEMLPVQGPLPPGNGSGDLAWARPPGVSRAGTPWSPAPGSLPEESYREAAGGSVGSLLAGRLGPEPVPAAVPSEPAKPRPDRRVRRLVAFLAAVVLALSLAIGAISYLGSRPPAPRPTVSRAAVSTPVRTAAPVPPPAVPSPALARLEVDATPAGARVWLDGVDRGRAPLVLEDLEPRKYQVKVSHPGYQTWRDSVTLEPDGTAKRTARLERAVGVVAVRSDPPGAKVFVDGELRGVTPLTLKDLPPGRKLDLKVRRNGYEGARKAVEVKAGERRNLAFHLEPLPPAPEPWYPPAAPAWTAPAPAWHPAPAPLPPVATPAPAGGDPAPVATPW